MSEYHSWLLVKIKEEQKLHIDFASDFWKRINVDYFLESIKEYLITKIIFMGDSKNYFGFTILPYIPDEYFNIIKSNNKISQLEFENIIIQTQVSIDLQHLPYIKEIKLTNSRFSTETLNKLLVNSNLTSIDLMYMDTNHNLDFPEGKLTQLLSENVKLKTFHLPSDLFHLVDIKENYTLLQSNIPQLDIIQRNNLFFNLTQRLAIVFIWLRQKNKILARLDKQVVIFIAKLIFEFQRDKEHLKILDQAIQ